MLGYERKGEVIFSLFLASDADPSGTSRAPLPNQAPGSVPSTSLGPSLSPCMAGRSSKSLGFSHSSSRSRGWRDQQSRKEHGEPVQCWLHARSGATPASDTGTPPAATPRAATSVASKRPDQHEATGVGPQSGSRARLWPKASSTLLLELLASTRTDFVQSRVLESTESISLTSAVPSGPCGYWPGGRRRGGRIGGVRALCGKYSSPLEVGM